jgi:hypothetical protein
MPRALEDPYREHNLAQRGQPRRWEILIPDWHPTSLNKLNYVRRKIRSKKEDRKTIHDYAVTLCQVPPATGPRVVSAHVQARSMAHQLDPDNILKSLLDALVQVGLLLDDDARHCILGSITAGAGAERYTRITLEDAIPIEEPAP